MSVALLTNNPAWRGLIAPWRPWESFAPGAPDSEARKCFPRQCFLVEGSPLEVLLAGRRLLHAGWRLLHHPLYGNFRPHRQPYRTLLWRFEKPLVKGGDSPGIPADYWSLKLLEEALVLYQNSKGPLPGEAAFREDLALLDTELLRPALKEAGWPE